MEKQLADIIKKLEHLEKRLRVIEQQLGITPPVSPEKLPIMKHAIQVIRKTPQASTQLLQKELSLSQQDAVTLYDELEQRGMIKTREINQDPLQPVKVGSVSKYKIKKFLEEYS